MKVNTQKFLKAYSSISEIENTEVIGKSERIAKEKKIAKLNSDIKKFGKKVTEEEYLKGFFNDLCCTWEEFKDCYQ